MKAIRIRTQFLQNPIGIDVVNPRITWNCEGGKKQTAYEIQGFLHGSLVFDTEKVDTDNMFCLLPYKADSRQRVEYRIRLWDENHVEGDWSETQFFEMGLLDQNLFQGKWINPELECNPDIHKPVSYLKKKFEIDKLADARLYITAHGVYEAWINGRRVGNFVLAPGSYNYDIHVAYQTYDVTSLLIEGENTIEVLLGDGWYRSVSGVDGDRNLYGTGIALLCQLEVDGVAVCVSDETWQASQNGCIRENDMQQGEIVDLTMETVTEYHGVKVEEYPDQKLICSNAVPIVEKEHFEGKLITTPNGQRVIDFGQNLAGIIEISVNAHSGQKLQLTCGETLDAEGNFTQENFQDRKRHKEGGTKQMLTITCKEGVNTYKPKFTIWGFRYALLETDIDLKGSTFTAIAIYSDMETLGSFSCGNPLVNQLVQNAFWSMKSNFCDVPTDCPTRERAAWTGDMGVFAHTGIYMMDAYSVIEKWLAECRLAQHKDGKISNIAPRNNQPSFFSGLLAGSVGWGDAVIIVPYTLYQRYGDQKILEDNYEMMKRWYAYLESRAKQKPLNPVKRFKRNPYRRFTIETGIDYGEWCEPDVESTSAMRTPQGKVATAYFAYSGRLLSEIAKILGHEDDSVYYQKLSENATKAWRFISLENGRIVSDRQADFVRAITFGLLQEDEISQAARDLNEMVVKNGYHLNTGFLSTPNLCRVLADHGYEQTAFRLLLQEEMPGWLYEVKQGATTIWETWDGKASMNHYSYGAILGWLFDGVAGIKVQDGKVFINPHPAKELEYVNASYQSPYGLIEVNWKYNKDDLKIEYKVPENVEVIINE